jgi:hypothetical protein
MGVPETGGRRKLDPSRSIVLVELTHSLDENKGPEVAFQLDGVRPVASFVFVASVARSGVATTGRKQIPFGNESKQNNNA